MARPAPSAVRSVACVGGGTIGSGWAAFFLSRGLEVVMSDPGPGAEARARAVIDAAWPSLVELGLAPGADRSRFRFVGSIAEAVSGADFVQESAPEREDLKIEIFAEMDEHAGADVILSSSSSAFLPSHLQSKCKHPERVVIGHPFAPSYLMPLVEVVGGDATAREALDWSCAFYDGLGKRAVLLKKEIEGYIANRFQMVVSEEATRLVEAGICTWEDVDLSITEGPGLRWPFFGPLGTNHLAGGQGGLRHSIDMWGWGGTDASREEALDSIDERFGHVPMADLERWRDDNLVRLLKGRRPVPAKPK